MATHQSAVKKQKRDEKKQMINRMHLAKMRNKIKLLKKKAGAGEKDAVKSLFPKVVATIDQTVSRGTIHKNTGARYKSRICHLVHKAGIEI